MDGSREYNVLITEMSNNKVAGILSFGIDTRHTRCTPMETVHGKYSSRIHGVHNERQVVYGPSLPRVRC